MNKPNCCEKCRTSPRIIPEVKRELEKLGPYGCWLDNCTCHSPKTTDSEDWEEKFDAKYKHSGLSKGGMSNIKAFIERTRTAAYESGKKSRDEEMAMKIQEARESALRDVATIIHKETDHMSDTCGMRIEKGIARLLDT